MDYNWPMVDFTWPTERLIWDVVAPGMVIAALLGGVTWGLIRRRWYGFVGAWFFLILGPSSSFAALNQTCHEHRMYLSLAAVIVLVVVIGNLALTKILGSQLARYAATTLTAAIVVTLAIVSLNRNTDYYTEFALWQDNIEKRPTSYLAHDSVGNELAQTSLRYRSDQALQEGDGNSARLFASPTITSV